MMAFMKINDLRGILTLVVLSLPSIAANFDCNGKPFHCVNSTHFMICVDLGSGVSSTIDDFVIPCPPTTVCQGTNRFECEFPVVITTTTTVAPQVTSVSETIGTETIPFYEVTTSIPFEEYFNTLSTTTLSEDILLSKQAIATESILPVTESEDINVILPGSESNTTLRVTIPSATNVVQNNLTRYTPLPNNISAITSEPNPDITENINVIIAPGSESNSTLSKTFPSATDVVKNNLATLNTSNGTGLPIHVSDIKTKSILTMAPETTPSVSIDVIHNYLTTLYSPSNTALPDNTVSIVTEPTVTESIKAVYYESNSTVVTSGNVTQDVHKLINASSGAWSNDSIVLEPIAKRVIETIPSVTVDVTQNDVTISYIPSRTLPNNVVDIVTEPIITEVTDNINAIKSGSNKTLIETLASVDDKQNEPQTLIVLSSTAIDIEDIVINVTENGNVIKPGPKPNSTLSETVPSDSIDIAQNYLTTPYTSNGVATLPSNYTVTELPSSTALSTKAEPVATNNVPINTLVNQANTTGHYYSRVTDTNSKTEEIKTLSAETTFISYHSSSTISTVIDNSNIITEVIDTTPNSIIETTVPTQEVDSITYSNVYYHTDTENIGNPVLANQNDGKPVSLSDKFISTSIIDNTASTPKFIVTENENLYTGSALSVTVVPVPKPPKEVTPRRIDDSITGSPTLINNQNSMGDSDPLTTIVSDDDRKSTTVTDNQDNQFIKTNITVGPSTVSSIDPSNAGIINTVIIDDFDESITIVPTTLATTFTYTETSHVFSSEPPNVVPTSELSLTEVAYSILDIFPNRINEVSDITSQNLPKKGETISTTSTTTKDSFNTLGLKESTTFIKEVDAESIRTAGGNEIINNGFISEKTVNDNSRPTTDHRPVNINDKATLLRVNTENITGSNSESSAPVIYPTTEVISTEVTNNSYIDPSLIIHGVKSKSDDVAASTVTTKSSFLVENPQSEMLSVSDIIPVITTRASVIRDPRIEIAAVSNQTKKSTNYILTAQEETLKTIAQEMVTRSPQTAKKTTTIEVLANTPEFSTGHLENSLVTNIFEAENSETSPKETYFTTADHLTQISSGDDIKSTVVNDNKLVTSNIIVDSSTISSVDPSLIIHGVKSKSDDVAASTLTTKRSFLVENPQSVMLSVSDIIPVITTRASVIRDPRIEIAAVSNQTKKSKNYLLTTQEETLKSIAQEMVTRSPQTAKKTTTIEVLANTPEFSTGYLENSLVTNILEAENTETSTKETYFVTADHLTQISSGDDNMSTVVNDNKLVTSNIIVDSSTISSVDINRGGDTKNPVLIKNVGGFMTTEETKSASSFTVTESSQMFSSEPSNVISSSEVPLTESAYSTPDILLNLVTINEVSDKTLQDFPNKPVTIATTSKATVNYSNGLGLRESTNTNENAIKEADAEVIRRAGGYEIIHNGLQTANISETIKKKYNTRPTTENHPVIINKEAKLTVITENITVSQTESSEPVFYPTTEVISTEVANNSYIDTPALPVSTDDVKSKSDNAAALTSTTMSALSVDKLQSEILSVSDIIPDIPTHASVVGNKGIGIAKIENQNKKSTNYLNTAQHISKTKAQDLVQDLVTSSLKTSLPVKRIDTIEAVANTAELSTGSLGTTLITDIFENENSKISAIESNSSVNKVESNMDTTNRVFNESALNTTSNNIEVIKENNPLVNLLLNSAAVQIPYREFNISSNTKPIHEETVTATSTNVNEVSEKPSILIQILTLKEKKAFMGVTQQETYSESTMVANIETNPSNENLSNGIHSINKNNGNGQPVNIYTPRINISEIVTTTTEATNDIQQIATWNKDLLQANQDMGLVQAGQSPVDNFERISTPQDITTETHKKALGETDQTKPTIFSIISQPQVQASMVDYDSKSISQNQHNIVLHPASTPSINDSANKSTNGQVIDHEMSKNSSKTQENGPNKTNTGINEVKPTISEQNSMAANQVQNAKILKPNNLAAIGIIKPTQVSKMVEPQWFQGVSTGLPIEISQIQDFDPLTITGLITESRRATVVTKPSTQITNTILHDEHPLIEVTSTGPNTKIWNQIPLYSNINKQTTRPNLDQVIPSPETEFINISHVTIKDEQPLLAVSSTEPTKKTWNKIPQTSKTNIETANRLIFNSVASTPTLELINIPKNNIIDQSTEGYLKSIPKRAFTNVPINSISQKMDEETTPVLVSSSSDSDVIMVDFIKTIETPVLRANTDSGTHPGISVMQKPPRNPVLELSEQPEGSESVEKPERQEGKENPENSEGKKVKGKEESPEAPESNEGEKNNVTPAIDAKYSKLDSGFVNKQNTVTPRFTNNKIKLDSTIEMTTMKVEEHSDTGYQTLANIEQFSTIVKLSNVNPAHANVAHVVSPSITKDKSVVNEFVVTAHIASNITSNNKNSSAHFNPQTKSSFANTQNTSVLAFGSASNSQNFVCKINSRGRFSDIKDCRKFYICIGKLEPIEGICPNDTVFSELRKQCTKNLSHCFRNNQFQCISEGRFSDYLNDSIYYVCVKNNVGKFIRFKLQCQSGYHLNKTSVRCELNTESSQSTSQQSTSDISKNNSNQSVSSAKSGKLIMEPSKPKKFECKKEGKFPDSNDCRKYYICTKIGKTQYRQKCKKCDSDELFHKDKKKCVDADSYECS